MESNLFGVGSFASFVWEIMIRMERKMGMSLGPSQAFVIITDFLFIFNTLKLHPFYQSTFLY